MGNTSHPFHLRTRIFPGWSRAAQPINDSRPVIFLASGTTRRQLSVVQAIGFDVLVAGVCHWRPGDKVSAGFLSPNSGIETTIPGTVHWLEQKQHEVEIGIALEDQIPAKHVTHLPDCTRASIRYPSNIAGHLYWLEPHSTSSAGIVVNYSREGICIHSKIAPMVGSELRFSWQKHGKEMCITGTSRWTISRDGGYLTGCELANDLGYAISGISTNSHRERF